MFTSGLLILTQPLTTLRGQIPSLLHRVSQVVSDTLYVHLQPVKGGNSSTKFLLNHVPVTTDFRNIIKDIYSIGSTVCHRLDIRVLLNHVTNNDIKFAQYPLLKGYNVVLFDDTLATKGLLANKGQLLELVKSAFLTSSDVEFQILQSPADVCSGSSSSTSGEASVLKTYSDVAMGGTFDRLHVGHKILLSEGCLFTEKRLTVGVSEGKMNEKKLLFELLEPLAVRTKAVMEFLQEVKPSIHPDVVTIYDGFGPTITDPNYQCIVLSEETRKGGAMINAEREKQGMNNLDEVVIQLVVDEERTPDEDEKVSSSSLRKRLLGTLLQPPKDKSHIPATPYRIGLTGGIASGKSAICRRIESLGAGVVDCDKLGHEAYKPGMPAFNKIKEEFGGGVVGADGNIDRKKLGGIIFADEHKRRRLNEIVWPEILKLAESEVKKYGELGKKVVVLDAAVLLEAGWDNYVHEVWSTFVPRPEAVTRMKERNNLSEEEAVKRLDSQLPNEQRLSHANVTLCTLWEYDYTQKQCEKAWGLLQDRINTSCKL